MILLDGKQCAATLLKNIEKQLNSLSLSQRKPGLAFILVGNHGPSLSYVKMKQKACKQVGMESFLMHLPEESSEKDLKNIIHACNENPLIDGILLQQPLPSCLKSLSFLHLVDSQKDVDGFHPHNMGSLLLGESQGFIPCTPKGIVRLMQHYELSFEGKEVVIIGRSNIVGKPLAALLSQKQAHGNATVTLCHQKTSNLHTHIKRADVLISAMGSPCFIHGSQMKPGVIAIDVGISRVEDTSQEKGYRVVGDMDFESVAKVASYLTPVPGGIGPMTIAMLIENTFHSFLKRIK